MQAQFELVQLLDALFRLKLQPSNPESQDLSDLSENNLKRLHSKAPHLVELSCKSLNNLAAWKTKPTLSCVPCRSLHVQLNSQCYDMWWDNCYGMSWRVFSALAPWQLASTYRGMRIPNLQHFSTWNCWNFRKVCYCYATAMLVLCYCCWCLFELTWDDTQGAEPSAMIQSESDTAASALRTTVREFENRHSQALQPFPTQLWYTTLHSIWQIGMLRLVHAQAMMCWCQRSLSFLDARHRQRSISTMLVCKFSMEPEAAKLQITIWQLFGIFSRYW